MYVIIIIIIIIIIMHACKQYIWYKSTFNTVHFDRSPFTCSRQGGGGLNDFKLGIFIARFQSDGAASMAVKGLIKIKFEKKYIF